MNTLPLIAITSLFVAIACAFIIIVDLLAGNKQKAAVMNVVWPVTALYAGPLAVIAYMAIGRKGSYRYARRHREERRPFWQRALVSTLHSGAGCVIGDGVAEIFISMSTIAIFGNRLYDGWLVGYLFAFLCAIILRHYAIDPMKKPVVAKGIAPALRAELLSLTFWQAGVYGWMALAVFGIAGHPLVRNGPVFWFMMQIAMLCGFVISYGINRWLLSAGIKDEI